MNLKYNISPQIKCYDSIGESFTPYLMRKDNSNKEFVSVSTNQYGFRNTVGYDGKLIDFEKIFVENENNFGVVLGSSAVFGTGASSDSKSIPSQLSQLTKSYWLNFGARAYNSTQEMILLNLHLKARPKQIVVFSGVNNLTLAYLCKETSQVYNSFFGESEVRKAFESRMFSDDLGLRRAMSIFKKSVFLKFGISKKPIENINRKSIQQDYNKILKCFERDLFSLKALADGHGSSLIFFMQPLATWLNKNFSSEEKELFDYLDNLTPSFKILADFLGTWRDNYFEDIESICKKVGVTFVNLNVNDFETPDWLFVDRVHLTDAGYSLAAKLIYNNLQ